MARKTDFEIRKQLAIMLDRVERVTMRFSMLDDVRWVLSKHPLAINKVIRKYKKELSFIKEFFTDKKIDRIGKAALSNFVTELKKFDQFSGITVGIGRAKQLTNIIKKENAKLIDSILDGMIDNIQTKIKRFNVMIATEEIVTLAEHVTGKVTILDTFGKKRVFNNETIKNLWATLEKRYGKSDTIIFQSGNRRPLNTYVDQKAITMATDIQNTITLAETAKRNLQVNRISTHGASDSCNIHEGTYVFINESAKSKFLAENPDIKIANTFKTFAKVKEDKSHIFGFSCRHRLVPSPLQFFPKSEIDKIKPSPSLAKTSKDALIAAEKKNKLRAAA